jgi:predicted  nucleic acid-binding Zn-ribbon protein
MYGDIFEDSWTYQEILNKDIEKEIKRGQEQGIEQLLHILLKLQDIDLALDHLSAQERARELAQERASLLEKADATLLALYNKLRRTGLGKVLSRVQMGACECCLAIITPSELRQIHTSEKPQTCSNCGRILYI